MGKFATMMVKPVSPFCDVNSGATLTALPFCLLRAIILFSFL